MNSDMLKFTYLIYRQAQITDNNSLTHDQRNCFFFFCPHTLKLSNEQTAISHRNRESFTS